MSTEAKALLGAFLLVSAFNLAGSPRPAPWTKESLDRYLREELLFEVESIELFVTERGRVPIRSCWPSRDTTMAS